MINASHKLVIKNLRKYRTLTASTFAKLTGRVKLSS